MIAYTLTPTSITVVVRFTPKVIPSSHPNFKRIVELASNPKTNEAEIEPYLDIPATITRFTGGQVTVQNGKLYHNGYELKTSLAKKIMEFINTGNDALAAPLMAFLNNVLQNPDPRAQADLFDWVQASGLPLTGDGFVLAWKAVRSDYFSIHAPTDKRFDHHVGNTVEMDRKECDDNPNNTCSRGLHFCSADYLRHYAGGGNRVVVVKIHPADVVAFPRDYGNSKGRACRYQIVGEVPADQVQTFYPQGSPVYTGFDTQFPTSTYGRSSVAKRAARNGKFAVGQVWKTRNGQTVKITSIDDSAGRPTFPIRADNGANFTTAGRYYQDRQSPADLISLVSDVA